MLALLNKNKHTNPHILLYSYTQKLLYVWLPSIQDLRNHTMKFHTSLAIVSHYRHAVHQ